MTTLLYILLFILSFLGMELIARFTHKYIMHGFLWGLHKDHHLNNKKNLEHNDWFSFIFAIPSFFCIFLGLKYNYPVSTIIGIAMAVYGFAYFLIHDVFIHQRIKLLRNINSNYFKAVRKAHKIHHKQQTKENSESFGFLIINRKYFKRSPDSLLEKTNI